MEGRVAVLLFLLVWQNTFLHLGKFGDPFWEKMVYIYIYIYIYIWVCYHLLDTVYRTAGKVYNLLPFPNECI